MDIFILFNEFVGSKFPDVPMWVETQRALKPNYQKYIKLTGLSPQIFDISSFFKGLVTLNSSDTHELISRFGASFVISMHVY